MVKSLIYQLWHNTDDYLHNAYGVSFGNADKLGKVDGSFSLAGVIGNNVIPPSPVITQTRIDYHPGASGLTLTFEQPTGINTLVDSAVHSLLGSIPFANTLYDALPDYQDGFGINGQVHSDGADIRLYEVVGHAGSKTPLDYSDAFEAGINLHVAWEDNPLLGRALSGEHLGIIDSLKLASSLTGFHVDLDNSNASVYGIASHDHQGLVTHATDVISYTHTLGGPAAVIGKLGNLLANDDIQKSLHLPNTGDLLGQAVNDSDMAGTIGVPQWENASDMQLA